MQHAWPIRIQSTDNMVSLRTNRKKRICDVALSAVLVLLLDPPSLPPFSGSSNSRNTILKLNSSYFQQRKPLALSRALNSLVAGSTFLPNWSRLPPTSSDEVQPIPGLQTRLEGGKEVAGNRNGDWRGCWRAWWTERTGAAVWLCLFQPRLHVSKQAALEQLSQRKTHPAGLSLQIRQLAH